MDAHTIEALKLIADLLLVPIATALWDIQKRLSKIEGQLRSKDHE